MMYSFYVTIHARAAEAAPGESIQLGGRQVRPLAVDREKLGGTALPCSFEEASALFSKLPRMFIEPDGSFVWTSAHDDVAWQVDGNLYDRDGRLLFVDAKGTCPSEAFDRLLGALGWPETRLMFQLTREAVFLDEDEFRRFAAGG